MIFKLSNLPKFFHTYICPRFYGGGGVPEHTTSTQTVNQSPWQNPVYQALMLGTAEKPGPMTSMLNNDRDLMAQWNAVNSQGLAPAEQAALGTWNPAGSQAAYTNNLDPATGQYVPTATAPTATAPTQEAAGGGIMSLQGYNPQNTDQYRG